jgi:acetolactate decarboxylase
VTTHIIDDRLIGALHLRALDRQGFDHDRVAEHTAIQVGTLDAIMEGGYEGDATLAEVLRLGSLGIGTVQQLDGELVVLDGEPWVAAADGTIRREPLTTRTPFAVVVPFHSEAEEDVDGPLPLAEVTARADRLVGEAVPVAALRVDGTFRDLELRSVARQHPPYPRLAEVVAHQSTWHVEHSAGTLLGFRFPDELAGVEVPGYHLHYLSDDRTVGGHVLGATLVAGHLAVDHCEDLHVELPAGVGLGRPGAADRAEISRLEGGAD